MTLPPLLPLFPSQVLASVDINDPRIPVYSNVTAEPFTDASQIQVWLGCVLGMGV